MVFAAAATRILASSSDGTCAAPASAMGWPAGSLASALPVGLDLPTVGIVKKPPSPGSRGACTGSCAQQRCLICGGAGYSRRAAEPARAGLSTWAQWDHCPALAASSALTAQQPAHTVQDRD